MGGKRKFQSKGKPEEMSLAEFQTKTPSSLSVPRTETLEKSIYEGFTILGSDSVQKQNNIIKAEPVFVMEKNTTSDFQQQPVKKPEVKQTTPPVQEETKQPPSISKQDLDKDEWQEVVAEKKEKKDKIYNQAPSHN